MIGSLAVSTIAARLGKRGTAFDSEILLELQAAQEEMETGPQLPWFLLNHDTTTATVLDTKTIAMPTDFLLEDDYGKMFIVDTDGDYNLCRKNDYDVLRKSVNFSTSGVPEQYALQDAIVSFFPTPNAAYTLDWHYYKRDDALTAAAANAWLTDAPMVLLNKAGLEMARFLRDQSAISIFDANYARAVAAMWARDEARRQAGMQLTMGG